MKDILRIGEIRYANCTPIYTTLKRDADCTGYEFVEGEPSKLNALLAAGEVDVSSSSSIEYARHADEYLIIPDISISSTGEVKSILLFSKYPVEALGGRRVSVSSASATSTVLLKALLRHRYSLEAELVPAPPVLTAMLDGPDAALLIGDEALKANLGVVNGQGLFVYDLGAMWQEYTGLPFVYALWMVRGDSAKRMPGLVSRFKSDILSAKATSAGRYAEIASSSPEREWLGEDGLVSYWNAMSYDLGEAHIRGLSLFMDMASGLGEAPGGVVLRFLGGVIY